MTAGYTRAVLHITVAIIAGNEESRIRDAVRSASWATEVLVLDSESSDGTVEAARRAGARVEVEPWRGYGAQKNRAAELAANDWVFSLDADERIDGELAAAMQSLPDRPPVPAFVVRRRNRFEGRPIRRWPWSWDRTVRLYDRRLARFSERSVHEALEVDGTTHELPGILEHFSYRGWDDLHERHVRYARLGAEEAYARDREPRVGDLLLRPAATFWRHWVGRGFLLGGMAGWRLSVAAARMTRMKYEVLRELWEQDGS